jgi:hypothetical protein
MRRVPIAVVISALAMAMLLRCGEKCPFEPCEPMDGRVCGIVDLAHDFPVFAKDLRIRTLAGSGELGCDRLFAVPVLAGCGAHLVVLAAEDTVPVLLGCCLRDPGGAKRAGMVPPVSGDRLIEIIGSPETRIRLSAASTAVALTMINPFLSGATVEERFWFASQVAAHRGFEDLVKEVSQGLDSSPLTYLGGGASADLYSKVSGIVSDIINELTSGSVDDSLGLGPYVEDAPGDKIALRNAAFVHYGVGVVDAVTDTLREILLLPVRDVSMFVEPDRPSSLRDSLGDGCVGIRFFKGVVGIDEQVLLDPHDPGGLATIANVNRAVWSLLSVFDALSDPARPGDTAIGGLEAVAGFADVIYNGGPANVTLTALECAGRHPEAVAATLLGDDVASSDVAAFVAAVRPVLKHNVAGLAAEGLSDLDRFAYDLIASPEYTAQCVCQAGGEMFGCPSEPVLSAGGVEPDSGDVFTEFTFLVHYYDQLGDPPAFVRVMINDNQHEMALLDGEPSDGLYRYAGNLSPGWHAYYFTCTDTAGATARLPREGSMRGAFVVSAPVLTNGYVEPARGNTANDFRYLVDCYDADGEVPAWVRVYIDGDPYDMERSYSSGKNHKYRHVTRLAGGGHDYYFECEDPSGNAVRLPPEGVKEGPVVSQYPSELKNPRVDPPAGVEGDVFTYSVDYLDQDGDVPWFVNVYHDGVREGMRLASGDSSNGTYSLNRALMTAGQHEYYFLTGDAFGALVRLPETGTFTGPYVERRPGGEHNYEAKIAVHVMAYDPHVNCDEGRPVIASCEDIRSTYAGAHVLAFPVFFDLAEYQGVEFGMTWPGWEGSADWHSCSDLSIGEIRLPGDGVSQVWLECHLEPVVVPGWLSLYADGPGLISPCDHPMTREVKILNCREAVDEVRMGYRAGVNGAQGDDPCYFPVPSDDGP